MYADSKLDGRENTDDGLQGEKRQKGKVIKKTPLVRGATGGRNVAKTMTQQSNNITKGGNCQWIIS
jgi:hypothetical protein